MSAPPSLTVLSLGGGVQLAKRVAPRQDPIPALAADVSIGQAPTLQFPPP